MAKGFIYQDHGLVRTGANKGTYLYGVQITGKRTPAKTQIYSSKKRTVGTAHQMAYSKKDGWNFV